MAKYNAFTDFTPMPYQSPITNMMKACRYGQWWVLKGLQPSYYSDQFYVKTLKKEYEIGKLFIHNSIVRFYGLEEVPEMGGPCIVEEHIDGVTLKKFLKNNSPSLELKIKLLREIVDALAYISSMQVVHRDIKPTNIMVTNNGQNVKIVDFGLSLADTHTILRAPAGSRRYIAPEQMKKDVKVDTRADIFSFGKLMEDCNLPVRYDRIIKKCTQQDRDKRYESFYDLRTDLRKTYNRHVFTSKITPWCFHFAVVAFVAFFLGFGDWGGRLFGYAGDKVALTETPHVYYKDTTNYEDISKYYSIFIPDHGCTAYFLKNEILKPTTIPESKAVDLGLSVDWAPFNLGCDRESLVMSGALVSYGDTTGHFTDTKPDGLYDKDITDAKHDIVSHVWGGRWRTPSLKEFEELLSKCQLRMIITKGYQPYYIVTGPNGNCITFKGTGYRIGLRHRGAILDGLYWTRTVSLYYPKQALAVIMSRDLIRVTNYPIQNGLCIRPVLPKKNKQKPS